jgi:hypothetical protein
MNTLRTRTRLLVKVEDGYVLILVMLVLMVVGIMAGGLLMSVTVNQQHVSRDRGNSQSLAVAEAGLNQYLWMVAAGASSESNDFAIPGNVEADEHRQTIDLVNADYAVKGTYTIEVTEPSADDPRIAVTVTGRAESDLDTARTVSAHIGRPSFSEYVLLTNDSVYIGGAPTDIDRVWQGKTHSNTGVRIETRNISDVVSCAQSTYLYASPNTYENGVWSQYVTSATDTTGSRALWSFPVPAIDFDTVTSDFVKLNAKATGAANLPLSTGNASSTKGYYIKLLPNEKWQYAKVTAETENYTVHSSNDYGGTLTYGTLSGVLDYPDGGVIYVNDNVWVEGTDLDGRITIACSGQLNSAGKTDATSIHVVGDILYSAKNGTVAVGLIAQNNVEIPMYAPIGKVNTIGSSTSDDGNIDMEIDAAIIAQQGCEIVNRGTSSQGPRRQLLTFYGSVSSYGTPSRCTTSGTNYSGFNQGANYYDPFLLHQPPPFFPTVGSYQVLDWQELQSSHAVGSE